MVMKLIFGALKNQFLKKSSDSNIEFGFEFSIKSQVPPAEPGA